MIDTKEYIFISYSRKDETEKWFKNLMTFLNKLPYKIWVDQNEGLPDDDIRSKLKKGVDLCKFCIFVLTRMSVASSWCGAELGAFWGAGKRILVYQGEDDANLSMIAPQLGTINVINTHKELEDAIDTLSKSIEQSQAAPLKSISINQLEQSFTSKLEDYLKPLYEDLKIITSRSTGIYPFNDNNLFGVRYNHFLHEKNAISKKFIDDLEEKLQYFKKRNKKKWKVRLILDSGTTIFPVFSRIIEKKNDPLWSEKVEIVTNNIPGLFSIFKDGRASDDPYSELSFNLKVVGGQPIPAYWAVLPNDPIRELEKMFSESSSKSKYINIGVVTGNYLNINGSSLYVRNRLHYSFKKAIIDKSQILYCLAPLGKLIPKPLIVLNDLLSQSDTLYYDEKKYSELEIDLSKIDEYALITTERQPEDLLFPHWTNVSNAIDEFAESQKLVRPIFLSKSDYSIKVISNRYKLSPSEIEVPHGNVRNTLLNWFIGSN